MNNLFPYYCIYTKKPKENIITFSGPVVFLIKI